MYDVTAVFKGCFQVLFVAILFVRHNN